MSKISQNQNECNKLPTLENDRSEQYAENIDSNIKWDDVGNRNWGN